MDKLDIKDRKILAELDINSRQSFQQIGKKVKLPKTVVHYRINSLIQRGIIQSFYSLVNFTKLGFTQYKIYFKFYSNRPEKEIINFFSNTKNVVWIASCRGNWDLAVTLIAKDIVEFDKILKKAIDKFGKYIIDKDVLVVSYSPMFSKKYLSDKPKHEFLYMEKIENKQIDEEEAKILNLLSENARIPVLDIMEKLKFTRDLVSYRIKKLEKDNIILGYRSLINLEKIDFHLFKVILRLQDFSEENEKEIVGFCENNKNITQYLRLVGNWDVEIEVETENEESLYKIINELRSKSNIIKDFEVLHIFENHKLNFFSI
jgi:Lrp/AsnC family transcriptional regulator, leucine-responsive regulatory protein